MATIRDIAKACGVSAMTVSSVLNKRRGAASPETQERILRMVEEMGYRPGSNSRGAARRYTDIIGVLMADCNWSALASDRYFGPILDGIFEASKTYGQSTLIMTEDTWEQAYENAVRYFDGRCDGLILMLPTLPDELLVSFHKTHIPFVCVGESHMEPSLTVVDLDNVGAGHDAANYLLEAGHRKIALFSGDTSFLSSSGREQGYRLALAEWGIEIDERSIFPGRYNAATGYRRMRELLTGDPASLPTAIVCGDDWIAFGVMQAIHEFGLKVPDDISIIGINNNPEGAASSPPLTTIHHPLRMIGQRAVDVIMAQMRNGATPGEKALLRGEVIIRSSVSAPNRGRPGV
ncbi:LacI family transcriptional regulator [Capsulimonas corticalis]|uniref:LacI family transcriptional regulator n=1 Tax=Capsulimonas corticalis TaxID=2219043 RepID=A0A402CR31_9BACT|nr:LacI family DNA-binding transcriptional regulator [Capsulimonas corticalis]BDI34443.1 LacI family transcriptional regulator [Capsulimonas corticalis]